MSPILVRPVREQLEHDRVIRLLQAKYKRKFEVAINPGHEQTTPVGTGTDAWYPDLVLQSPDKNRKLMGVVEVETAESVNHLEAMSQWAALSRLRAPFHLYVPAACVDSSRRLAADLDIAVAELWAYQAIGDQMRFTVVQRTTVPEPKPVRQDGSAVSRPQAPPDAEPAARPTAAKVPKIDATKPVKTEPPKKDGSKKDAGSDGARKDAATAKPARKVAPKKEAAVKARPKTGAAARPAAKAPVGANGKTKTAAKAKTATRSGSPRRPAAKAPARKTAGRAPKRK